MQQYKPPSQASERKLNSPLNCIRLLQPKLTRCNFQHLLCQQQTLWNKVLWTTKLYFSSTMKPCYQHSYLDSCIIFMWVWSQWINKVLFLWYFEWVPFKLLCSIKIMQTKSRKRAQQHSGGLFVSKSIKPNDNSSPSMRGKILPPAGKGFILFIVNRYETTKCF